jgi:tRNA 2-selenouridine synthase
VEFDKGAFPHTLNLPLMSDEERHLVGKRYKEAGNTKAIELGHQLVSGEIKDRRVRAWIEQIHAQPETLLYCFRGGQRSQISQQWLHDAGITIPRLRGGYKAFRSYLIEQLETITQDKEILVIGGHTGSGKTILLKKLRESIDLEGIANHRGSSFGRYASPQPTQIDFENSLAYHLIRHDAASHPRLIIEDESKNIGRVYIPPTLFTQFTQANVILLETTLEERIEITYDEYILASQAEYGAAHLSGETEHPWIDTMRHNFVRIRKRLGDQGYRELSGLLDTAWKHQLSTNDPTQHKLWIAKLLTEYYDPMYAYQIEQKRERIVFRGNQKAIIDYVDTSE